MSLKYQRVKQADLLLPAPLRWLTRAFSSVTLAVTLLVMVVLYGVIASVPLGLLALAGIYLAISAGSAILLAALSRLFIKGKWLLIPVAAGLIASVPINLRLYTWFISTDWFALHRAMVVYRLPYFEMTELEFYSWWPLKLILCLFMLNLIWATIRRIEFKLLNIGVLTVHTGIITIGVGSILYGIFKVEGDTILWREDLKEGRPVNVFYDATTAAIYFDRDVPGGELGEKKHLMLALPGLPRYNDYDPGSAPGDKGQLDIPLDRNPAFAQVLGLNLHASIPGFYAYARLDPLWVEAPADPDAPPARVNPALQIAPGDADKVTSQATRTLVASLPGQRAIDEESWGLEFLHDPSDQRIKDLHETFEGEQGLIVDIPAGLAAPKIPGLPATPAAGASAADFHQVYSIRQGQSIDVGQTGYRLTVEKLGPYEMSFATAGYEGASDTRAMIRVEKNGQLLFRRIVMFRYPERSQDFIPLGAPGNPRNSDQSPAASGGPSGGPMMAALGKRTDPNPAIRLTYLDASKPQYHLIAQGSDLNHLSILLCVAGYEPVERPFDLDRFPLPVGRDATSKYWIHITQRFTHAVTKWTPRIIPRENRMPKEEGTYINSLLPVDLSVDVPGTPETPAHVWRQRVWLPHMRYPLALFAESQHHPVVVDIPTVGRVSISFSRQGMVLPFWLTLENFEMTPYPGTDIPRDFLATMRLVHVDADGKPDGQVVEGEAHLNNPLVVQGVTWHQAMAYPAGGFLDRLGYFGRMSRLKFSQTGWDPGDKRDPKIKEKNEFGRFVNQQRFTILGVGSNFAIHIVFVGACLMALGIPMAFYLKPALVQRQKRKLQAKLVRQKAAAPASPTPKAREKAVRIQ